MDDKDIFFGTLDEMFGPPVRRTETRVVVRSPNLQQIPKARVSPFLQMARQNWDLIREALAVPPAAMQRQLLKATMAPYVVTKGRSPGLSSLEGYCAHRDHITEARDTSTRLGQPRMDAPHKLKLTAWYVRSVWHQIN